MVTCYRRDRSLRWSVSRWQKQSAWVELEGNVLERWFVAQMFQTCHCCYLLQTCLPLSFLPEQSVSSMTKGKKKKTQTPSCRCIRQRIDINDNWLLSWVYTDLRPRLQTFLLLQPCFLCSTIQFITYFLACSATSHCPHWLTEGRQALFFCAGNALGVRRKFGKCGVTYRLWRGPIRELHHALENGFMGDLQAGCGRWHSPL